MIGWWWLVVAYFAGAITMPLLVTAMFIIWSIITSYVVDWWYK